MFVTPFLIRTKHNNLAAWRYLNLIAFNGAFLVLMPV